jgi:hypothetical protein
MEKYMKRDRYTRNSYICIGNNVLGKPRDRHGDNVRIEFESLAWAGHVARMGEKMIAYRILVGMPEGKRPPGTPRRRWVDNIKMDLREMGWRGLDGYGSGYGSVEGSCEHGIEPSVSIKCWEVLELLHNWLFLQKGSGPLVSKQVSK